MVLVRNVELTSYHQEEFWERSKGERMLPCPRNHKQCYNDHHNLLQSNCPPVKNKIKLKKKKKGERRCQFICPTKLPESSLESILAEQCMHHQEEP